MNDSNFTRKRVIEVYVCQRCDHEWVARKDKEPEICPRCKSHLWRMEKKSRVR